MPDRAGKWKKKTLRFRDQSEDTYVIRYRNSLEAVKTLLGDPRYRDDIVYKPTTLFKKGSTKEEDQIYSEFWTGKWWNDVQVEFLCIAFAT